MPPPASARRTSGWTRRLRAYSAANWSKSVMHGPAADSPPPEYRRGPRPAGNSGRIRGWAGRPPPPARLLLDQDDVHPVGVELADGCLQLAPPPAEVRVALPGQRAESDEDVRLAAPGAGVVAEE